MYICTGKLIYIYVYIYMCAFPLLVCVIALRSFIHRQLWLFVRTYISASDQVIDPILLGFFTLECVLKVIARASDVVLHYIAVHLINPS